VTGEDSAPAGESSQEQPEAAEDGSSAVPEGTVARRLAEAEDKPELALTQDEAAGLKRGQEYRRAEQDIKNRRRIADAAIVGMIFQIVLANTVFIIYALTMGAELQVGALQVWLLATVVQIVGVIVVITQYLFPPQRAKDDQ
jgi:magnesium-transporting ATPase (P-type)